jgi:hypothetical protein
MPTTKDFQIQIGLLRHREGSSFVGDSYLRYEILTCHGASFWISTPPFKAVTHEFAECKKERIEEILRILELPLRLYTMNGNCPDRVYRIQLIAVSDFLQ